MQPTFRTLASRAALAGALLLSGMTIAAASAPSPVAPPMSPSTLVRAVTDGQVVLDRTFPGPAAGIQGVLGHATSAPKRRVLFWMIDDRYLVDGALFNAAGDDLTRQAAIAQGLIPKPMPKASLASRAAGAQGFVLGKSGPLVLAFEDPNCSACHLFWQATDKDVAGGTLRVRVIPVGFLKPDSAARAATILSAANPAQAWQRNESGFDAAHEEGGLPLGKPSAKLMSSIAANTALLEKSGAVATPTLVYCDRSTGAVAISRGWDPAILHHLAPMQDDGRCVADAGGVR